MKNLTKNTPRAHQGGVKLSFRYTIDEAVFQVELAAVTMSNI